MKESRENAFCSSRSVSQSKLKLRNLNLIFPSKIQQLIKTIVKEELANEIELHENILKEILDSWDEWQQEEYEKEFLYLNEKDDCVFCPVCENNLLKLNENIISCVCGLR